MATSFLFNSSNGLDRFRDDSIIQGLLANKYVLLNFDEFTDWYMPPASRSGPSRTANYSNPYASTALRRQVSYDDKTSVAIDVLPKFATMCHGIGEDYGRVSVENVLNSSNNFDLLVAVYSDYEAVSNLGTTKTVSNNKIKQIVAFIIVELGECQKKPNTVSVRLICGIERKLYRRSFPPFKAGILLAAYLYCIKNSRYDQEGILELAGGYPNVSGFMTYTKLGFNYDKSLYGPDCFDDFHNLPMSVNLVKMSLEDIVNWIGDVTRRRIDNIDDPTMLYKLKDYKDSNPDELLLLQNLGNMLYRLELAGQNALSYYMTQTAYLSPVEDFLIKDYIKNQTNVRGGYDVESFRNYVRNFKDRLIKDMGKDCSDGVCDKTVRCINGVCNWFGQKDAFGGKNKRRRHKTKKHKTRKHKTRKHKTKKHKTK
jgi:hypothetical protein